MEQNGSTLIEASQRQSNFVQDCRSRMITIKKDEIECLVCFSQEMERVVCYELGGSPDFFKHLPGRFGELVRTPVRIVAVNFRNIHGRKRGRWLHGRRYMDRRSANMSSNFQY